MLPLCTELPAMDGTLVISTEWSMALAPLLLLSETELTAELLVVLLPYPGNKESVMHTTKTPTSSQLTTKKNILSGLHRQISQYMITQASVLSSAKAMISSLVLMLTIILSTSPTWVLPINFLLVLLIILMLPRNYSSVFTASYLMKLKSSYLTTSE